MDFIYSMFINLCLLIDTVIYSMNVMLFKLFLAVSQARFPESVFDLVKNLYVIIGIFMVFRVAFSLIQMLANPDMMSDKEKGAGKLATRIVIAFGLIILVPSIFSMAYNLQSAIIGDDILGKLILGDYDSASEGEGSIEGQGETLAIRVFTGMISPGEGAENHECIDALNDNEQYRTIGSLRSVGNGNIDCFTEKTSKDEYVYNYKFLVSSLATGMVAWLMVGFCIDIGTRLIKLTFLQLIAPICIVTYVGGGKENSFGKWLKMTISSYISVFVKLVTIYFVIYMADAISDNLTALGLDGVPLGQVVVILGLLVFAKNATNLIGDLFGIKMDQESGFKGIAKTALLGAAGLAAGGGVAGIGSAISQFGASRQAGNGVGKALLAGAGGLLGGGLAGAVSGAKSKTPFKAVSGGAGIAQKRGQQTLNNGQTGWWERTGARVAGGLGMQTTGQKMKSNLDALNQYAKGRESIKSIAEGDKTERTFTGALAASGYTTVNDFKEDYERAVAAGASDYELMWKKLEWDEAAKQAINQDMGNANTSIGAINANMNRLMADNAEAFEGMSAPTNASELSTNYGEVKNKSTVLEQSAEYQRATQVDNAVSKNKK